MRFSFSIVVIVYAYYLTRSCKENEGESFCKRKRVKEDGVKVLRART